MKTQGHVALSLVAFLGTTAVLGTAAVGIQGFVLGITILPTVIALLLQLLLERLHRWWTKAAPPATRGPLAALPPQERFDRAA